jgi:hypothetical protein
MPGPGSKKPEFARMAAGPPAKVASVALAREGSTMKTDKPVKKTGKLTAKKIEKKAPLVRFN